ncbi:unnamed protein product [Parascedosporium putredinis]|uniref:Band 7 domain-containing protein n=1 Tax=Parascedosporium putredinis TaxID=1442378 RepID=A0A9P1H8T8_9PEZI|nr:unnamed protein product [Parascedosporium putredinis]CAI8001219.1 unnamed protein product [Parascedosporium putredinis]
MSNVNYGTTPAEGASVAPALGSVNGSTAVSAGKRADLGGRGSQDDGFAPEAAMIVEPARQEDLQRSYATIVDSNANPKGWYGSMINSFGGCIGTIGAFPCCPFPNPYKNVSQGHVGLVTKFGKFYKAVDPGLVKIAEVPQQTCMTKDNAAFGISNVRQALIERTQTTLRHVVGARILQDVIERREEIAGSISEIIEDVATGWGVRVESMLIKDIIFSQELQESLSMAAQSKRIGESKIIAAQAEVESAKLMRQAADILSSAPAMQIRYLEAMQAMAKSANSKVIFLPAANQTMPNPAVFNKDLGESSVQGDDFGHDFSKIDAGLQQAVNARIVEHI